MLVQALAEYADTRLQEQLEDLAFEDKPVPYLIEIGQDGAFLGIVERADEVQRGKKKVRQVQTLLVPKSPVNRNTGLHPLLGCDDIKYVVGKGAWTGPDQEKNHEERHQAFVEFLEDAARTTSDAALQVCAVFYGRADEVEKARKALAELKAKAGSLVALSVGGPVVRREAVRRCWREHYQEAFASRTERGGEGMCIISGKIGPIAPTHEKIKGLGSLGGQPAGVALMSFDKDAFCSYGWEKNANSPVSPERAAAYVLALNDLLRGGSRSRVNHCGVGFLFWTKKPVGDADDPVALIENADPERVRKLLLLDDGALRPEPNDFYLMGVSGNGGRLLVRYWLHESLETVLRNVNGWFRGLRIASPFSGEPGDPPKLWQLLGSLAREGAEPPPDRALQLLRRAIHGVPLGRTILAAALSRRRVAEGKETMSTARAGLIRLCVNDQNEGVQMSEVLDKNLKHPAYLCGRLLALYDGLQYTAHQGEVNSSVSDRYYLLASTYPALAFPKLADLELRHLKKLRRDNPGAAKNIEKEIQEVYAHLAGGEAKFPAPFSLEDQGRFAIGYHHQRAEGIARAMARKQEKANKESREDKNNE
jgi:CRISPR-associated protein Csd1